jgi:uncharacterized ferritin-like protein (DUF455 family)
MHMNIFDAARQCLDCPDPGEKVALTRTSAADFFAGNLLVAKTDSPPDPIRAPGRPEKPGLVPPRDLRKRGLGSNEGRAAFLHAIAHIEFNAINLAWDAVYRFRDMPGEFYCDWVRVADDEARHFSLLSQRLRELDASYGDFLAHNGLWEMAEKTAHSCLARMALVPRVLEARGLDVTPAMIVKLRALGDRESAEILELILREEIAHVAAGSRWFVWCCEREGVAPRPAFAALIDGVAKGSIRGPFNRDARIAAGFDEAEMRMLEGLGSSP